MNACFMGNLEAVATLAGTTTYIIASEDADIAETYDYQAIIRHLSLHPATSPEELARLLMKTREISAATGIHVRLTAPTGHRKSHGARKDRCACKSSGYVSCTRWA